jgi:hypothetical protein
MVTFFQDRYPGAKEYVASEDTRPVPGFPCEDEGCTKEAWQGISWRAANGVEQVQLSTIEK